MHHGNCCGCRGLFQVLYTSMFSPYSVPSVKLNVKVQWRHHYTITLCCQYCWSSSLVVIVYVCFS